MNQQAEKLMIHVLDDLLCIIMYVEVLETVNTWGMNSLFGKVYKTI